MRNLAFKALSGIQSSFRHLKLFHALCVSAICLIQSSVLLSPRNTGTFIHRSTWSVELNIHNFSLQQFQPYATAFQRLGIVQLRDLMEEEKSCPHPNNC